MNEHSFALFAHVGRRSMMRGSQKMKWYRFVIVIRTHIPKIMLNSVTNLLLVMNRKVKKSDRPLRPSVLRVRRPSRI